MTGYVCKLVKFNNPLMCESSTNFNNTPLMLTVIEQMGEANKWGGAKAQTKDLPLLV